ncbi:hypothetical protein DL89DRAFT_145638 [Linderina pennispora]|uniref:Uncharacterized protein n=1 Tax=Linderina pennispora TaxID=61395 RepID=A0A1Y1VVH4_9FUNG|nr:uncharacterized protein DL89DRAFT_145638 [Linderina pennispora]ORX64996.1 hypothetical protein DL89DRAFT_145638 [Linderina pennispora]
MGVSCSIEGTLVSVALPTMPGLCDAACEDIGCNNSRPEITDITKLPAEERKEEPPSEWTDARLRMMCGTWGGVGHRVAGIWQIRFGRRFNVWSSNRPSTNMTEHMPLRLPI